MSAWTDAVTAVSPFMWHRMLESSGTTYDNAEGTAAMDGTLSGTGYTQAVAGPITSDAASKGITFSAAGLTGINMADNAAYDFGTNDFSIAMWIKRTAAWPAVTEYAAGRGDPTIGQGWELGLRGSADNQFQSRFNGVTINSGTGTTIVNTGWHFVVLTLDRDANAQFYLDGATYGAGTSIAASSGTSVTGASSAYWGRRSAGNYVDMSMAECFACSSLLSAATIANLYDVAMADAVTVTPSPVDFRFFAPAVEGMSGSGSAGAYTRRRLLLRV